jgi:hypothetical protein
MSANFDNLDWVDGQSSVPGIYSEAYYIPKSSISEWPELPAAPASAAEEVTYQGDFALVAAKTWKRLNAIDVKSQPQSEPQGEIRCKSYGNKLTLMSSLTEEKATAFAKLAANTDLVWLFREKDSGKYRVVGSEMFLTETKVSMNIGSTPTGEKGITVEINSSDVAPFLFYAGAIVTDDGDINPSS